MNRDDYMNGTIDHETYYRHLADTIGRERIEKLVRHIATPDHLKAKMAGDEHLNNIPLHRWDALHPSVLQLVRENGPAVMAVSWPANAEKRVPLPFGSVSWSLSESVCVLKAAARRMAETAASGPIEEESEPHVIHEPAVQSMPMSEFIAAHRDEIDAVIRGCGGKRIDDEERELWILNDETLYNWARSEGVEV